jgi:FtsP/CotA-like multicopper oxidase with cupredoxin domain
MRLPATALLWLATACSGEAARTAAPEPVLPTGPQRSDWDQGIAVEPARDTNMDPHVFETTVNARVATLPLREGPATELWTFDGQLPGRSIRLSRGDRLIVHFENDLPEATTIHWHGIRLPNAMDGVPDVTQPAVPPGGRFDYDFVVPDAGTFWYHPHVRSAAQVGFGLYGALLVTDPDEPDDLGDELSLVLSDIALLDDNSLEPPDQSGDIATLFGREGDTLLVNGRVNPVVHARAGRRQRWRLVNVAKSRYFQLGMAGHRFTRIAGDGGLVEHPVESDTIVLAPAERAEVIVTPVGPPGAEISVRWIPYEHGFGTTFGKPEIPVFRVAIDDDEPYQDAPLPELGRAIDPPDIQHASEISMQLTRADVDGKFALGINGEPAWLAEPILAKLGETQIWNLSNTLDFAHPFHLHGYFFQVLSVNGVAPAVREWKDTADVPVDGTTSIAVKFDERPGMWMYHCHILDHADAGMMGMVHVH